MHVLGFTGKMPGSRSTTHKVTTSLIVIVIAVSALFSPGLGSSEDVPDQPAAQSNLEQEKTLQSNTEKPTSPSNTVASEQEAADQAFLDKKQKISEEFKAEKQVLSTNVSKMKEENRLLEEKIRGQETLGSSTRFLLGMAFLTNWGLMILLWFFPIMILNHFLYLVIREKEFFTAHRLLIVITFCVLEALFLLPLVSYAESVPEARKSGGSPLSLNKQPEDPFETNLKEINELLNMSEVERALYILNNTKEGYVSLRKLKIKDPILIPWDRDVRIGSPEYFFVLAYIYRHLGNEGKANTALEQMVGLPLNRMENDKQARDYIDIYDSVLGLFIKKSQLVDAGKASEKLIDLYIAQEDFSGLKRLCEFLATNGMEESAKKVAGTLIRSYEEKGDSDALIEFSKCLTKNQMEELATQALEKAAAVSKGIREKILLAKYLIDKNQAFRADIFIDQAIEALKKMQGTKRIDDSIYMAHFLFDIGKKEMASTLLDSAKNTTRSLPQFLKIVKAARELGFLSIAIDAINVAANIDQEASRKYVMPPPHLLPSSKWLPSVQDISLITYLGILQQVEKKLEDAELSYKMALVDELEAIIQSCGYDISGNINEFFYLKQLWQKAQPDKLRLLLPIYTYLQEEVLQAVRDQEQEDIVRLTNRITELKDEKTRLVELYEKNKTDQYEAYISLTLLGFRTLAICLALLLIMTGWVVKATLHAKLLTRFKFYGFCAKLFESMGWSACFSLVGILVGVPIIIFSQFMEILHANQQSVERFHHIVPTKFVEIGGGG